METLANQPAEAVS